MVRACRPPARERSGSGVARRSTMTTSTSARANSAASIIPVGPPPAITTACSVIATPRPDTSTTTHPLRSSHFRIFWLADGIMRHDPGLAASPPVRYKLKVERSGYSPFPLSSAVDGQPPREAAARRVGRYRGLRRISHGLGGARQTQARHRARWRRHQLSHNCPRGLARYRPGDDLARWAGYRAARDTRVKPGWPVLPLLSAMMRNVPVARSRPALTFHGVDGAA